MFGKKKSDEKKGYSLTIDPSEPMLLVARTMDPNRKVGEITTTYGDFCAMEGKTIDIGGATYLVRIAQYGRRDKPEGPRKGTLFVEEVTK